MLRLLPVLVVSLESLSGEAKMSGEVLEPGVTTAKAGAVAKDAREAVSGPLVLTESGRSWTLPPPDVPVAPVDP